MFSIIKIFKLNSPITLLQRRNFITSKRLLLYAEHLKTRSLLQAEGENVSEFLQGLITNDMNHLTELKSSMYTMFLNVQGRVLFDAIVHKRSEDSFLIECDKSIVQTLANHLKLYKVRRKLFFKESELRVWSLFDDNINTKSLMETDLKKLYVSPVSNLSDNIIKSLPSDVIIFNDPRLHYLGNRLFLSPDYYFDGISEISTCENKFKILRYKLGIGEGIEELQRGKCLPLEANCDYLHGISFQKGCYIGQELTARIHHTGVVRKRFMPLVLDKIEIVEAKTNILNEKGKSVGKVICMAEGRGIGIMKISDCLNAQSLKIGDNIISTFRPGWWPIEMPKQTL